MGGDEGSWSADLGYGSGVVEPNEAKEIGSRIRPRLVRGRWDDYGVHGRVHLGTTFEVNH